MSTIVNYFKQVKFHGKDEEKYIKMTNNRLIIVHINTITGVCEIRYNKLSSLNNYVIAPSDKKEFDDKFRYAINWLIRLNDD